MHLFGVVVVAVFLLTEAEVQVQVQQQQQVEVVAAVGRERDRRPERLCCRGCVRRGLLLLRVQVLRCVRW